MFRMAVGHSDDIDVETALDAVIRECDVGLQGAIPAAGLLLASWDSDHGAVVERIRGRYPGIELAGATAAGEMSSVLGLAEDSVALALFASLFERARIAPGAPSNPPQGCPIESGLRARAPLPRVT